jgi:universal stress protein A
VYTTILHATDLNTAHFDLCQQAANIAQKFNAKLFLLHVIEPPASLQLAQGLGFAEFDSPLKEDAETVLRTVGDALNIPVEQQFIEVGAVKTHTQQLIDALQCDLLIIGSHHAPHHLPALLGNTARHLIESASCDVLTLRAR